MAEFSWDLTDNSSSGDTAQGGSGNALASILSSVSQLGTAALISYGPQNQALATNPSGQAAGFAGLTPTSSSGLMSIVVIGLLVIAGFFVFKKL